MTTSRPSLPRLATTIAAATATTLLVGCTAKSVFEAEDIHSQGNFQQAADVIHAVLIEDDIEDHNRIWANLEAGKIHQDAGRFELSIAYFEAADAILEGLADRSVIDFEKGINESFALVTDERNRDYFGSTYDHLTLQAQQAINHLMAGDTELAAVYARRLVDLSDDTDALQDRLDAQRQAFEDQSQQNNASIDNQGTPLTFDRILQSPSLQQPIAELRANTKPNAQAEINPYNFFIATIALLANGNRAEAQDLFRRLQATAPNHPATRQLQSLTTLDNTVVVFFEAGRSPKRTDGSFRIGELTVVPLPVLRSRDNNPPSAIQTAADTHTDRTTPLSDFRAIVYNDFNRRLFEIWGRPILSVAIKVASGETATQASTDEEDETARFIGRIITGLWVASAKPDLRTWHSLPAQQAALLLPRPQSNRLDIQLIDTNGATTATRTVPLKPSTQPAFIFVRATTAQTFAVYLDRTSRPLPTTPPPTQTLFTNSNNP